MPGKQVGGVNHRGRVKTRVMLEVRTRLGLTQVEMGGLLSITSRQYGRIERGEVKIPQKTWLLFSMFALMMIPGSTVALPETDSDEEWLQ